jgi:hypothetical protein
MLPGYAQSLGELVQAETQAMAKASQPATLWDASTGSKPQSLDPLVELVDEESSLVSHVNSKVYK